MTVTKTLTALISGSNYPYNYAWSSTCGSGITYSAGTGTIASSGNVVTNITYDSATCLDCLFSLTFDNGICIKKEDDKSTIALTCGLFRFLPSANSATVTIVETGFTCHPAHGTVCQTEMFFGTYTINITSATCDNNAQSISVTCNGVTQTGPNTSFTVTTNFANPTVDCYINCA